MNHPRTPQFRAPSRNLLPREKSRGRLAILSGLAVLVQMPLAVALTIANGDFESGDLTLQSGSTKDLVTQDMISGSGWYASNNPGKTFLLTDGGPTGTGRYAAVQGNSATESPSTTHHRGIVYVASDNFETRGQVTLSFDALAPDATGSSGFLVKVWGVNDGVDDPGQVFWDATIDLTGPAGNADGLDLRDLGQGSAKAPSYTGTIFTSLFTAAAADLGVVFGPDWQSLQFTFDVGATGYDQIIIGFSFLDSPNEAPFSGIDNLRVGAVPEPATIALLLTAALGVGGWRWTAARRRS